MLLRSLFTRATLALAVTCVVGAARADYLLESFENMTFVNSSHVTLPVDAAIGGYINNGPTPTTPAPLGGPAALYPVGPFAKAQYFGNNQGFNFGTPEAPAYNTGWGDQIQDNFFSHFAATTYGVTDGLRSIRIVPSTFGGEAGQTSPAAGRANLNLAFSFTIKADPEGDNALTQFLANKYIALDVTYKQSDWLGSATGQASLRLDYNQGGPVSPPPPLIDQGAGTASTNYARAGYKHLGDYTGDPVNNPAHNVNNPLRVASHDSGNPGSPGVWDYTMGNYTTTLYFDYSAWKTAPDAITGATSTYDLRDFINQHPTEVNGDAGWIEFVLGTANSDAFTAGAYYVDNVRFVSSFGGLASDGDYDDNGVVNAADIDILWHIVRGTATDPNSNDTADLDGNSLVNEDDVDLMLSAKVPSAAHKYGDADIDADVDGADFDAWRLRAGYTGSGSGHWSIGDFDGDGDVDGADFDLWRLRPSAYPTNVRAHGDGPGSLVPEPSTLVLLGLALPALGLVARRRNKGLRPSR